MSGKIMGMVWNLDLIHSKQLILLAMADHADHEGRNIRPNMALIAWKTGYSRRQVQRIVADLVDDGLLVVQAEATPRLPAIYRIDLSAGLPKLPYGRRQNVTPATPGVTPGGTLLCPPRGDTQMSPDPSIEPSIEPSENNSPARESLELEMFPAHFDLDLKLMLFTLWRITGLDYRLVDGVMEAACKYLSRGYKAEHVASIRRPWEAQNNWRWKNNLPTEPTPKPKLHEVTEYLGRAPFEDSAMKYDLAYELEAIIERVRLSGDMATIKAPPLPPPEEFLGLKEPDSVPALESGGET